MKHLVRAVALATLVIVPATAHAQVSGGFRVGVNLANLPTDPDPTDLDLDTLTGLTAGVFVTLPVNAVFAFQPEVLYSQQGAKLRATGVTIRTKVDYVQVPLLARVRTGTRSPLSILFGPSLGFKTGAKLSAPGLPAGVSDEFDDTIKGFDFGLTGAAGLDFGPLVIDARYTWGLTNIVESALGGGASEDKVRNRVIAFSAGLRF